MMIRPEACTVTPDLDDFVRDIGGIGPIPQSGGKDALLSQQTRRRRQIEAHQAGLQGLSKIAGRA